MKIAMADKKKRNANQMSPIGPPPIPPSPKSAVTMYYPISSPPPPPFWSKRYGRKFIHCRIYRHCWGVGYYNQRSKIDILKALGYIWPRQKCAGLRHQVTLIKKNWSVVDFLYALTLCSGVPALFWKYSAGKTCWRGGEPPIEFPEPGPRCVFCWQKRPRGDFYGINAVCRVRATSWPRSVLQGASYCYE